MIALTHVRKLYPGSEGAAVTDLSLEVPEAQIAVLVGPSGCGKSTTLRMINRLVEPTSGRIEVDGHDVSGDKPHELRQRIGYVIQQVGLFPHRTIAQNVATVPELLGWDKRRIGERVEELLSLVGLEAELARRYPGELSGGQQQRVGVARALAADPPVLLMDEPFGAVDPIVRTRLQDELVDLQKRLHKTIVFVTHDIDEAIRLGDQMAVLDVGGILEQYGPPADVLGAPRTEFVAAFLGTDRSLKRLSLIPVSSSKLDPGPVVSLADDSSEALRAMAQNGTDWVVVVGDGRLRGWVDGAALDGQSRLADLLPTPFAITLHPTDSLRHALDALVSSPHKVAVVVDDDGNYLGLLDVDAIGQQLER